MLENRSSTKYWEDADRGIISQNIHWLILENVNVCSSQWLYFMEAKLKRSVLILLFLANKFNHYYGHLKS